MRLPCLCCSPSSPPSCTAAASSSTPARSREHSWGGSARGTMEETNLGDLVLNWSIRDINDDDPGAISPPDPNHGEPLSLDLWATSGHLPAPALELADEVKFQVKH